MGAPDRARLGQERANHRRVRARSRNQARGLQRGRFLDGLWRFQQDGVERDVELQGLLQYDSRRRRSVGAGDVTELLFNEIPLVLGLRETVV